MTRRVGLVTAAACAAHDGGAGHPERPARLVAIEDRLGRDGLLAELERAEAPPVDRGELTRVHPAAYVDRVSSAIARGDAFVDTPDCGVSAGTFDAALAAAGGAVLAVDRVVGGDWDAAFCALRPPGHHAEEERAMGFCFFGNAVVAARHAQAAHGLARVAIVDWDVHHGNGTQHLLEEDGSVLYASLHQFPHYPGTGAADERGRGAGEGATLNLPQPAGSGDREWLGAFEDALLPALEDFAPELVIVSAGFDAHELDPLSATRVTEDGFARMTRGVLGAAGGRVVSLLEGGYSLEGLARSAAAHVAALREG